MRQSKEEGTRSGPHICKTLHGVKEVSMVTTTQILKKLQLLQELIGEEDSGDEVTDVTLSKLLNYELDKLRERQNHIRGRLTTFEEAYRLKTEDFVRQFREGAIGDAVDFFEWAALADMYHEISQRLAAVEQMNHERSDPGTPQ
jgi:hypothetical protein